MAPKKKWTSEKIIEQYFDYVLTHDHDPKSVYAFCKEQNRGEDEFYQFFTSFEALRAEVFCDFHHHVMALLSKDEEMANQSAHHQLLSYYYTFFEMMSANRSFVVFALKQHRHKLEGLKQLSGLGSLFKSFVDGLPFETLMADNATINSIQQKGIKEAAWVQLLVTIKFWLDDTSAGFEKTDVFIDKSVSASFDLLKISSLDSVIDFAKFMFKEKVMKD